MEKVYVEAVSWTSGSDDFRLYCIRSSVCLWMFKLLEFGASLSLNMKSACDHVSLRPYHLTFFCTSTISMSVSADTKTYHFSTIL